MKIGIVGLGLIGGSIFKKLELEGYDVIGISQSQCGKQPNIFDSYSNLKGCEIVFVCTPMNKTLETLETLEKFLSADTLVTDVCSLKTFVSKKKYNYKFVPSHPMAGTEKNGFENSFAEMFQGAKWVLTPIDETDTKPLEEIVHKLGAKTVFTTPRQHDEAVAMVSHMPMIISQALFLAASENEFAMNIAATGFQSMTRLAMENEEMAEDMVNMNAKNIQEAILKLYSSVGKLLGNDYRNLIKDVKEKRLKMYNN